MTIAIDTLAYTKKLMKVGFTAEQAEVQATTLDQALKEQIATKADLENVKLEVTSKIEKVDSKIEKVDSKIDATRWILGVLLSINLVMLGVMLSKFY